MIRYRTDPAQARSEDSVRLISLSTLSKVGYLAKSLLAAQQMLDETRQFHVVSWDLYDAQAFYHSLANEFRAYSVTNMRRRMRFSLLSGSTALAAAGFFLNRQAMSSIALVEVSAMTRENVVSTWGS